MTEAIESLFIYVAIYISLLPILFFFWKYKSLRNSLPLKIVAAYCACEFVTNYTSLWVPVSQIRNLYSIFTALEYGLFAFLFFLFIANTKAKKGIYLISFGFYLFWCLYRIFGKYRVLDSIPIGVETILILLMAFWYLFEQMDKVTDGFIYNRYHFWIACAIMLYLAGSFFCYIFANQVDKSIINIFWMFTNIFTTIKCSFFLVAMLVAVDNRRNGKVGRLNQLSF
ncbi:hypothetical protein [Flaviaesturariibacter amylovorans]|uniref:hypothetical protein n=1 Tax=Flaviaesturariibacter amylovorans TaxID=1084520 RepID=UPI0031F0C913